MDVETRTRVVSSLDASGYVQGAQQVTAANERIAASGAAVASATERQQVRVRENGGAIDRLQRSLDGAYRANQQLERAQNAVNSALQRGAISQQRATELITLAQQRYAAAGTAATAFATANDNATTRGGRFTQAMGAAGFQLQDFIVQVQGGTSALTALSQQGSQFLGMFGIGGAIAGAVLTVGILAARFLDLGGSTERATEAEKQYADAVNNTNGFLLTAIQRTQALSNARRLEETGTIEEQLEAQRARYRDIIAEQARLRGIDVAPDQGAFVNSNIVPADRARLALLDGQEGLLRGRIAELERRMAATAEGASGEERDQAEQLRRTLDERYRIHREHEEKIVELRRLASRGLFPGHDLATAEAQAARKRDEELEALARRENRDADRAARTAQTRLDREEQQRARAEQRDRDAAARSLRQQQGEMDQIEARRRSIGMPESQRAEELAAARARAYADTNGRMNAEETDRYIENARAIARRTTEVQRQELAWKSLAGVTERAFDNLGDAFGDALATGKWDDFRSAGMRAIRDITNELIKMAVVNPLRNAAFGSQLPTTGDLNGVFGGAGGFLRGLFSGGGGGITSATADAGGFLFHGGGVVGEGGTQRNLPSAIWREAPRYHSGGGPGMPGLGHDEVPAVLLRRELVMTERQQDAVARRMSGARSQGGARSVTVNVNGVQDAQSFGRSLPQMKRAVARALGSAMERA